MACPFLKGLDLYSCSATRDVYIPSRFELKEYCTSTKYNFFHLCSAFCARAWHSPENAPSLGGPVTPVEKEREPASERRRVSSNNCSGLSSEP
jgi:hypothetical protein